MLSHPTLVHENLWNLNEKCQEPEHCINECFYCNPSLFKDLFDFSGMLLDPVLEDLGAGFGGHV